MCSSDLTLTHGFQSSLKKKKKEDDEGDEPDVEKFEEEIEKESSRAFDIARARKLASPDVMFLIVGAFGALMAGAVFPAWGVLFAGKGSPVGGSGYLSLFS